MRKILFRKPWALLALALAVTAHAAHSQEEIRPMIKVGFDFGGDTLATVRFTDGSTQSIKANQGIYFGVGASVLLTNPKDIEVEGTVSYKEDAVTAANGEVIFSRVPLDALVFYRFPEHFRVGGGLTYHLNPKLSGNGVVGNVNIGFDNALGWVLQAEYLLPPRSLRTPKMTVGARYTMLDYKTSTGATAKSNGIGVTFSIGFLL
jgi:hypothetical protein